MATELSFAKSFLSLLDTKPPKISPDHVEDPRTYPGSTPYTLPRHASLKPFTKPSSTSSSTTSPAANDVSTPSQPTTGIPVTLRSPRNPPLEITLPPQAPTTSLGEIKELFAAQTGLPVAKIKLLHNKKPVADSKALNELAFAGGSSNGAGEGVELGVMVLGGAAAVAAAAAAASGAAGGKDQDVKMEEEDNEKGSVVAQGLSGNGVLETGQFWEDLRGFLQQRIRDEGVAGEALGVFKGAWEGRRS